MPGYGFTNCILIRIVMTTLLMAEYVGLAQDDAVVSDWPVLLFYVLLAACVCLMVAVLRKAKFKANPLVLAVWSLWMLWVFLSPVWFRLDTELDGVVTSAQDIPPTRGPRYATRYTLRGADGKEREYIAGATWDSLPRSMPIGTYLKKPKWTMYYDRDGRRFESGFPLVSIVGACFGCWCLVWSTRKLLHEKRVDNANRLASAQSS
jgi:hypothetical protein